MTAKGHVVLAVTPLVLFCGEAVLADPLSKACVFAAAAGSLVPDIDEPNSYIGRRLYFVSAIIKGIGVGHRTLTHRLVVPIVLMIVSLLLFNGTDLKIALAFVYGIFMHGIGDLLTRGGIDGYFYPLTGRDVTARLLPKRYAFYTGSVAEYALVAALVATDLAVMSGHL